MHFAGEEGIDLSHLLERAMTLERWRDDLLSDDGAIDSILAYRTAGSRERRIARAQARTLASHDRTFKKLAK